MNSYKLNRGLKYKTYMKNMATNLYMHIFTNLIKMSLSGSYALIVFSRHFFPTRCIIKYCLTEDKDISDLHL